MCHLEIDLDNLEDDDIVSMTSNEVEEAIIQVLQNTDKKIQIKIIRAIMRYQNIDGLDLEETLEKELDLFELEYQ